MAARLLGGNVTGDTAQAKRGYQQPRSHRLLLIFVIVIDVFAFLLFPPFDKDERRA